LPPVRRQPGLAGARARRPGSTHLLPAPLPGRRGPLLGAQDAPPSTPPRRRPHRSPRSSRVPPPSALMALGLATRRRLPAASLTARHLIRPFRTPPHGHPGWRMLVTVADDGPVARLRCSVLRPAHRVRLDRPISTTTTRRHHHQRLLGS